MTDKEIVQALRCCAEGECKDCAMHEDTQRCQENLLAKAAEAIERLTAENTALREKQRWIPVTERMPEEIKAPFTEDTMINLAAQAMGVEPSRIRELAEADKDGRCVVLPCKVGDTVWRIIRDGEPHITRDEVRDMYLADDMTPCVELVGGRVTFTEKFGKTVFLSRAEAKRALQEMEGKKDG